MAEKKIKAILTRERVMVPSNVKTREIYDQGRFGEHIENKKMQYSLIEALYLQERAKINIYDNKNKKVSFENFLKKAEKYEPRFWIRYCVYRDLRKRGYIVKTALKFGADFRVYERGVKPGEEHAKWIVYPVHEAETLTWYEWAAKNRVAHSTRKNLLLAVVDEENDVSYWEARWLKP